MFTLPLYCVLMDTDRQLRVGDFLIGIKEPSRTKIKSYPNAWIVYTISDKYIQVVSWNGSIINVDRNEWDEGLLQRVTKEKFFTDMVGNPLEGEKLNKAKETLALVAKETSGTAGAAGAPDLLSVGDFISLQHLPRSMSAGKSEKNAWIVFATTDQYFKVANWRGIIQQLKWSLWYQGILPRSNKDQFFTDEDGSPLEEANLDKANELLASIDKEYFGVAGAPDTDSMVHRTSQLLRF